MKEVVGQLAAQHAELESLLVGLDDDGWRRPTPCVGWDVADVVLHLAQTDELALASATARFADALAALAGDAVAADVDEGADAMVRRERHVGPEAIHARWREGADELRQALEQADPHERVTWVAGQLSARTLATTRIAETWIHTTDVAEALGVTVEPTERLRLVARLAWRTLPYAFAGGGRTLSGPVAFHLTGPGGEAWDYDPDDRAATVVEGPALDLCLVAGRRRPASATSLRATGPDADAVLELVRTYA